MSDGEGGRLAAPESSVANEFGPKRTAAIKNTQAFRRQAKPLAKAFDEAVNGFASVDSTVFTEREKALALLYSVIDQVYTLPPSVGKRLKNQLEINLGPMSVIKDGAKER